VTDSLVPGANRRALAAEEFALVAADVEHARPGLQPGARLAFTPGLEEAIDGFHARRPKGWGFAGPDQGRVGRKKARKGFVPLSDVSRAPIGALSASLAAGFL
jgi:hypothetical protein